MTGGTMRWNGPTENCRHLKARAHDRRSVRSWREAHQFGQQRTCVVAWQLLGRVRCAKHGGETEFSCVARGFRSLAMVFTALGGKLSDATVEEVAVEGNE